MDVCSLKLAKFFLYSCYEWYCWICWSKLAIGQYHCSVDCYFKRTGQLWAMKRASAERSGQCSRECWMRRRRIAGSPSTAGSSCACRRCDWTSWVRRLWPRNGLRRTQQRLTYWSAEIRATHIYIFANNFIFFYQGFCKEMKILTCIQNKVAVQVHAPTANTHTDTAVMRNSVHAHINLSPACLWLRFIHDMWTNHAAAYTCVIHCLFSRNLGYFLQLKVRNLHHEQNSLYTTSKFRL
jgi:hypothetical protein